MRDKNEKWSLSHSSFFAVLGLGLLLALLTSCAIYQPLITGPLVGPVWEWTGTTGSQGDVLTVASPSQFTIQFQSNGTYSGNADCNSISGRYSAIGTLIQINPGPATLVACPPGSLDSLYTGQLFAAESYDVQGTELTLILKANGGRMHFRQQIASAAPTATAQATGQPTAVAPTVVAPTPVPPTAVAPTAVPPTALPTAIPLTATPVCPGPPTIEFFVANPLTIQRGQGATLSWGRVINATAVAIDQGIGGVPTPGSSVVVPGATTTYTMLATGCGGQSQATVTVNVIQPTAAPTQPPATNTPIPTTVPTQPPPPTNTPVPTAEPTQPPPPTNPPEPTVPPGANLIGFTWLWTGATLNDGTKYAPPNPNQYTLAFNPNGTVAVTADCNQANGTWVVSGNSLTIVITTRTTALCPPDSLSDQYLTLLQQAGSYQVQGSNLTIQLKADSGIMTFGGTKG